MKTQKYSGHKKKKTKPTAQCTLSPGVPEEWVPIMVFRMFIFTDVLYGLPHPLQRRHHDVTTNRGTTAMPTSFPIYFSQIIQPLDAPNHELPQIKSHILPVENLTGNTNSHAFVPYFFTKMSFVFFTTILSSLMHITGRKTILFIGSQQRCNTPT